MANRFACVLIIVALAALSGCQQTATVGMLPPPDFSGPVVVQRPVVVAAPILPRVTPTLPMPRSAVASAGVPRDWLPNAPARPWRWIVIHHSATSFGSATIIDRWHRDKGWDELGYHFVIGNGTNSGDGQIEVGPRWPKQKWGAHTKTADNRFNDFGIGICLVGNFDIDHPTQAQMRSVAKLVAYLMKTYHISADHVLGHGDAKPTDCPGRNMSVAEVRRMATHLLADAGDLSDDKLVATEELLQPADK